MLEFKPGKVEMIYGNELFPNFGVGGTEDFLGAPTLGLSELLYAH